MKLLFRTDDYRSILAITEGNLFARKQGMLKSTAVMINCWYVKKRLKSCLFSRIIYGITC